MSEKPVENLCTLTKLKANVLSTPTKRTLEKVAADSHRVHSKRSLVRISESLLHSLP